ncbi:MAG: hypothetical protein NTV51_18125 [Verrucomicrobia bacterium]|nr:hypothetical protein [Verrucomicrobiota bacterium]
MNEPLHQAPLAKNAWRQIGWITAGALAVFLGMRFLPTGTNLNHMDFRVSGQNSIEFCDPSNPQFIPVVAVRSPVTMTVRWDAGQAAGRKAGGGELVAGSPAQGIVELRTVNGKRVEPQDLLVAHTRKLHLLIVDPTLTDYQHVHPEPGHQPGEWTFAFTPQRGGTYRVFADFTPAATARGLYASADVEVDAGGAKAAEAGAGKRGGPAGATVTEREGFRFALETAVQPIRAGQPADMKFSVTCADGGPVPMEPVMDAYAHLVAFDEARSGFAHLHPMETDLAQKPDAARPTLSFKITIPRAGRYVVWAQVKLGGREVFAPFEVQVAE